MKAAARRNDAEAVKMVSGFVFRDFGCEQRRLAAVSRWHIVAVADQLSEAENAPCRTGKHSGPEGRNGARNEPKNSLTSLLKP